MKLTVLQHRSHSIMDFKACPQRYRLRYVEGLQKIDDTDSLRMGTNWHALHEVYANALHEWDGEIESGPSGERENCAFGTVVTHLNERYKQKPDSKTSDEWGVERETLLNSFLGYQWRWQDDPVAIQATEKEFEFHLKGVRKARFAGRIDALASWQGKDVILERKSTSRSLDADSDYWRGLDKDIQLSMYSLAPEAEGRTVLYDVWRKPTIRQKQKETPDEYGQRLLADIQERPTYYFARREIARTSTDLARFIGELGAIHKAVQLYRKHGCWFCNEKRCRDPYPCEYIPVCYGKGADAAVLETPQGFKRLGEQQ